ncbi:fimbria/pilus outer membrane usher protein [Erythrobacter sp. NE805]|uniref:fimbria/pilus outer membrane usher protein n=1 Tax=Erythrobacter sp. NE805 TaxID=3389875 RepID=UPI00396AF6AE
MTRHGRLMLVPLLTATGSAAWAAPAAIGTDAGAAPIPPDPIAPDVAAAVAATAAIRNPRAPQASLFIMHPVLEGHRLPQVTAEFDAIELRGIEAGSLYFALGQRLSAVHRDELRREAGRFLPVARLQDMGIVAAYDPANLTLSFALVPEAAAAPVLSPPADPRLIAPLRALDLRGGEAPVLFGALTDLAEQSLRKFEGSRLVAVRADGSVVPVDAPQGPAPKPPTLAAAEPREGARDIPPPAPAPPPADPAPPPAPAAPRPPRVSRISMPPVLGGNRLALVTAELTLTELRGIEAGSLESALGDKLAAARRGDLKREAGNFLPVDRLAALGITAAYDPANLIINLAIAPEAVGAQTFDFMGDVKLGAAERVQPADFALGITGNLVGSHDFSDPQRSTRLAYNFAGFLNIGGRDRGGYLLFGGLVNLAGRAQRTFERDRLVLFKDFEGPALRVAAGDLNAGLPLIAGEVDVAGISLERRYDALQPLRNIRPTGRRQFTLDRPARIEIYANGALVQALDVNAGPVDLNRIPALSLSTNIRIIVEDATGRREIDSFTLANDIELLGKGLSEFNVTAGFMRKPAASGFAYSATPLLTGQYARGFSDLLTAGAHFALMADYQNVGVTVAGVVPGGTLIAGASASHHRPSGDLGYAVSLAYRGDPFRLSDLGGQLNFRLDYRSADYRRLSQSLAPDPVKLDMALDYRVSLSERVALSLGGNYLENHGGAPATRAVFAGVQASFGRVLASATARYADIGGREDRGILATLTIPLGRSHFSTASYDTVTRQARLEARRVRDITVPEFDYGLIAERTPLFGRLTGQARYANSRLNLDVEMVGTRAEAASGLRDSNLVNFRLQSGIAFADGEFGIGRNPGRGFVMVDRHASLKDARVEVETSGIGRRAGQSNQMGPAVVGQLSGYRPDNIRVSVLGAPPGYDIGAGEYLTLPGAFSGVRLTIGSDAYRSALVTFVMPDGAPVKLADGVVRNLATGETSGVFTNAAGRAVLSKLGAGHYRVEFVGGDLVFEFAVAEDAPAIIRLGTQKVEVAR